MGCKKVDRKAKNCMVAATKKIGKLDKSKDKQVKEKREWMRCVKSLGNNGKDQATGGPGGITVGNGNVEMPCYQGRN